VPRIGELVAIPNVGAYGLSASLLAFLGHPTPVEVVVDGGRVVEATRLRLDRHTVPTARRGTTIRNGHDQHAKERDAS
jgi:diaminopimelate decarboxylase